MRVSSKSLQNPSQDRPLTSRGRASCLQRVSRNEDSSTTFHCEEAMTSTNSSSPDFGPATGVPMNALDILNAAAQEQELHGNVANSLHDMLVSGAIVEVTVDDTTYEGVVVGLEGKRLYLETVRPGKRELHYLNTSFLTSARVLRESDPRAPFPLPNDELDMNIAADRLRQKLIECEDRVVDGVSLEGIETFVYMKKTFDLVSWKGKSIIVTNNVLIEPPYDPEHCSQLIQDNVHSEKAAERVRNMLARIPPLVEARRQRMKELNLSLE
uniref:AD domain-containing protein n=1 Tax=Panagrellus redivivus TaxID=6233 RepID=A0A7E4VQL9_PANRE